MLVKGDQIYQQYVPTARRGLVTKPLGALADGNIDPQPASPGNLWATTGNISGPGVEDPAAMIVTTGVATLAAAYTSAQTSQTNPPKFLTTSYAISFTASSPIASLVAGTSVNLFIEGDPFNLVSIGLDVSGTISFTPSAGNIIVTISVSSQGHGTSGNSLVQTFLAGNLPVSASFQVTVGKTAGVAFITVGTVTAVRNSNNNQRFNWGFALSRGALDTTPSIANISTNLSQ